jgi:oleate hydratase
MDGSSRHNQRSAEATEAWVLGSGTASLASAVYLITHAKLRPSAVHILDEHLSLQETIHRQGSAHAGYDQFAGCLPVPIGPDLKEFLDTIPSAVAEGQSFLDDIQQEEKRLAIDRTGRTCFIAQKDGCFRHLPTESLNLGWNHRINLIRLLMKREKTLQGVAIRDFFRRSFFESTFWTIWSMQFGFQPWHSAAEFRRAIRQYLSGFRSLSISSCLDVTGHYQYESIYLPIYFFLQSQGVDFQFGTKIRNIETTLNQNQYAITQLSLSRHGLDFQEKLGPSDIVLATLGSTVSGCAIGTNDHPPSWHSIEASDHLDANWSLWLEVGNKYQGLGNPYTFCTRKSESILESFTVTTEDIEFFDHLESLSQCPCQAGAMIIMKNSSWRLSLCLPVQPVFPQQPQDVRVLWGFALLPEIEGDHVKKNMLSCSGAEVMSEILYHLDLPRDMAMEALQRSIVIPRAMPRMSSTLLTRSLEDRARIAPESISNLGLVGSFVETPGRTCVDVSYGVHAARIAVSHLMGLETWPEKSPSPSISRLLITLICK